MGIYVNPGNVAFRKALNSEIYVDKTDLIEITNKRLNTANCYLCVSRPRRFGKSMAMDTLVAYYSKGCNSADLFAGKKAEAVESFGEHLNQHNVIRIDMQQFIEWKSDLDTFILQIENRVIQELKKEFTECLNIAQENRLKLVLEQIYVQTGKGFIFIIDEWDCVFRLAKEQKEVQKNYLDFLRGLFKGQEYIELGYLTYDRKTSEAFIPNYEITEEFLNVVEDPGWEGVLDALNRSEELLKSTWKLDETAVNTLTIS